ncbi:metal-dependent hydrolase [Candidatus Riesia pediculicola]|uniref:metal-dependent hydrolase n=1 Tax=Candidatus Riesia pediculicola TaxID=401619 RepID=UPI0009C3BFE6|nr:hypothetical protein AOE57_00440 [Candidatus Riesia pediculicola]
MTFFGHLWFSISLLVFFKKLLINYEIFKGDFLHLIVGSVIGSMIPDIDHPCSKIGRSMRCISVPIYKLSGHRGITHSLIFWITIAFLFSPISERSVISCDFTKSFLLGYLSHIVGDLLTKSGVPLFWPFKKKFGFPVLKNDSIYRVERMISIILIILSVLIPKNYSSNIIFLIENLKNSSIRFSNYVYSIK